jgi:hypothetical protein
LSFLTSEQYVVAPASIFKSSIVKHPRTPMPPERSNGLHPERYLTPAKRFSKYYPYKICSMILITWFMISPSTSSDSKKVLAVSGPTTSVSVIEFTVCYIVKQTILTMVSLQTSLCNQQTYRTLSIWNQSWPPSCFTFP